MDLSDYCTLDDDVVRFDEAGASAFAKGVAGDFNPIHDPGSRRFCVPGDLLFAVLLRRYGVFAETAVRFAGMLDAEVALVLPPASPGALHVGDARGREVLSFFGGGRRFGDAAFVERLSLEYVRFSGQTFPDLLVGLMREAGVMLNPERPLVIYKDMALRVTRAAETSLGLTLADTDLSVTGKKGVVRLRFHVEGDGERIGEGEKNLVLSGLRPFEEAAMAEVVGAYEARRDAYARTRGTSAAASGHAL